MRKLRTPEDLAALRAAVASRAAGWVLYEGGERLAGLGDEGVEIAGAAGGAVLRAEARLWRVVGFEERGGALCIAVRGAFGRVASTLRIARDGEGPLAWGPDWFEEALGRALERRWGPDFSVGRSGDKLAGSVRTVPGRRAALVALAPGASERAADDLLGAGLVARDRLERASGRAAELLVYSAPPALGALAERLAWLEPRAAVRLFDVAGAAEAAEVRPHDQGSLPAGGRTLWPHPSPAPDPLVDRILAVAPGLLRRKRRPGSAAERITLLGLECARVRGASASFGLGARRERLDDASWPRFESLVRETAHYRSAAAPDRAHPLYRAYPEQWLASLLEESPAAIDPTLDPSVVYEQVPARRRDSRDYVDLLAVTKRGRLAVVELKADVDRALPFQGLNYWSRVRWHHARGEIARRGYFPGVALDPRPPLLYLVAPLFRFHASTRIALALFSREIEAVAVGLNTDWRSGPRALARYQYRAR